jgi:RNA polymerase-binding protein DksA
MNIERYKKVLLKLRARVEDDFEGLRRGIVEDAGHPSDMSHVRTHLADLDDEGLEIDLIMGQTEHQILQDIEDALERIAAGSYGTCEDCGEPISEKRLRAIPYTAVCVPCEEKREALAP